MDRYLPREMMIKTKFIVFNRCVSSIKSADGCHVIFCQVRGINSEQYHDLAVAFSNSKECQVLIVSYHVSWKNFEKKVEEYGGIKEKLVGSFKSSCVRGNTSTSFCMYYKDHDEYSWETDAGMCKCIQQLENLTLKSADKHLEKLCIQAHL